MKKVLVTGGAGYIGSHTVRLLVSQGIQVVVLDNLVYGHPKAIVDESVMLVNGDLGDAQVVNQLFSEHSFSAVIHFAAYTYVGESVENPLKYYENNMARPLALLQAMQRHGCRQFIFSSTCATYGEPQVIPITEQESQTPINAYGESKLMLEKVLDDCYRAWGLKSVCLRYFNACGASEDGLIGESHDPETHLIPLILETALGKRDAIKVFGTDYDTPDGSCVRDYIHVDDLASAHYQALTYLQEEKPPLKCNLGTGQGYSVKEVIEAARAITGKEITVIEEGRRAGDPAELIAAPSLAKQELGWVAEKSDLHHILKTAWQWELNRRY